MGRKGGREGEGRGGDRGMFIKAWHIKAIEQETCKIKQISQFQDLERVVKTIQYSLFLEP